MSKGSCLCGSITWELLAQPYAVYNCHCRMCQKVHGAAFGTYCFIKADQIRWTSSTERIVAYRSSAQLVRSACRNCGSVVPYAGGKDDHWVAPAGCQEHMRKPDYNIFVAANSPWHTISGNLPEYDAYPPESAIPGVAGIAVAQKREAPLRGSCLCGAVTYQVHKPIRSAHNCHCSRCRRGRAAAHATNGFVAADGMAYRSGAQQLKYYKVPDAKYFTQVFCRICSSLMPRVDERRNIAVIPLSSLDDDPGVKPADHIYVNDKANWHTITDDLPQYPEGPP